MPPVNAEDLRNITDFHSLVTYLRDTLHWRLDAEDIDDLTFEYEPKELGLESQYAVKLRSIKQLRPLSDRQPFGVFYLEFEPKRLPVVVLRRILRALVPKKRQTSADSTRAVWNKNDLLFISQIGEGTARRISFAHFKDSGDALPVLHTFDWDASETQFHSINQSLEKLEWPDDERDVEAWRDTWTKAFPKPQGYPVKTSQEMSVALAHLARDIRDSVKEIYAVESANGSLHTLFIAFQKALVHDLTPDGFADTIAQTIAYGLFAAKVELDSGKLLGITNLADMIPATNPFLRELFREIEKLSGEEKGYINFDELGVSALADTLNKADMGLVLADFGRQTGGGREDPVIYFYELFLKEYDKKEKVKRGEFYTPKPVVSYIVRSVDTLLREKFELADGLADTATWGEMAARNKDIAIPKGVSPDAPFVQILDPATGTGTFLENVIEVVHETLTHKWNAQRLTQEQRRAAWNEYVPKHLLPRLNAFELKMAPYAIAHVKLGLKLKQLGYDFQSNERLRVFLTNTLEPPLQGNKQFVFDMPEFLSHEASEADAVKRDTPITVVIGNPPYSLISSNMQSEHRGLVEKYKTIGGVKIQERGALQLEKILNDDYVKFWAKSEDILNKSSVGVLGLITNHSFLNNPTMRGLRYSLIHTFPYGTFIDLGGSAKKIIGGVDENVFDIQQGVAISILVKKQEGLPNRYQYTQIKGSRAQKYTYLWSASVANSDAYTISPTYPFYLLIPVDSSLQNEYDRFYSLNDIFPLKSIGLFTSKDSLVIDYDAANVYRNVSMFKESTLSDTEVCASFGINAKSAWNVAKSRQRLKEIQDLRVYITRFRNRPFDAKYLFYDKSLVWSMAWPVNKNMLHRQNLALTLSRQLATPPWRHIFCSDSLVELCYISNKTKEGNHVLPLYEYADDGVVRRPNISKSFLLALRKQSGLMIAETETTISPPVEPNKNTTLDLGVFADFQEVVAQNSVQREWEIGNTVNPEGIFHYIYAILHSPEYRIRYADFLKMDFPRLPLTSDVALFRKLCALGSELVGLHLMEMPLTSDTKLYGKGENVVETLRYEEMPTPVLEGGEVNPPGRVCINKTQYLAPVPPEVYAFHIGGYQVCNKWLKDRKGRTLSAEDVTRYAYIVEALKRTIDVMARIDAAIEEHGGFPLG